MRYGTPLFNRKSTAAGLTAAPLLRRQVHQAGRYGLYDHYDNAAVRASSYFF